MRKYKQKEACSGAALAKAAASAERLLAVADADTERMLGADKLWKAGGSPGRWEDKDSVWTGFAWVIGLTYAMTEFGSPTWRDPEKLKEDLREHLITEAWRTDRHSLASLPPPVTFSTTPIKVKIGVKVFKDEVEHAWLTTGIVG